jgi:hypothetical protein
MRTEPWARSAIALAVAAAAFAAPALAQLPAAPALRIEGPPSLPIGASRIAVVVRLPQGPTMPLLLTVSVDGEALQVVRARFLRADAKLEKSGELRFEVPVLARVPGIALLRADLATYRCEQSCLPVRAHGALQVQVETNLPRQ